MKRSSNRDNRPNIRPVKHIELNEKGTKLKIILSVVFFLLGIGLLVYSLNSCMAGETGWITIEADSNEASCASEFIFQYYFNGDVAERKQVYTLYSNASRTAYQLFSADEAFEGVHNIYYINCHPNEIIAVDEVLYQAFLTLEEHENRDLYLAPIYRQYDSMFYSQSDLEAVEFDPYQNPEQKDYLLELASMSSDPEMVSLELLDENRVLLKVSETYLQFAEENDISDFIDFYWMKNAFIIDYLAQTLIDHQFTAGSLSSYDGFIRNLDYSSNTAYNFNLFDRIGQETVPAAIMKYQGAISIVFLRNYMMNSLDVQHYYKFENGEIRTCYIDASDGLCKEALNNFVCYSYEVGCAEMLMNMHPIYVADMLETERLKQLTEKKIEYIYFDKSVLLHSDAELVLDYLYEKDSVRYTAEKAK